MEALGQVRDSRMGNTSNVGSEKIEIRHTKQYRLKSQDIQMTKIIIWKM
jgi:hypothetical protein